MCIGVPIDGGERFLIGGPASLWAEGYPDFEFTISDKVATDNLHLYRAP